jgi:large repetitive protein
MAAPVRVHASGTSAEHAAEHAAEKRQAASFTASGLPPGIRVDPNTGVISGTVDRTAISDGKMTYDAKVFFHDVNGAEGSFNIYITLPNAHPVARDDVLVAKIGTPSIISVLANDSDADGDPLVILWAKSDRSNIVTIEGGNLKFAAISGKTEKDVITYAISDGHSGTANARVQVSNVE